jgi:hypothetical protein
LIEDAGNSGSRRLRGFAESFSVQGKEALNGFVVKGLSVPGKTGKKEIFLILFRRIYRKHGGDQKPGLALVLLKDRDFPFMVGQVKFDYPGFQFPRFGGIDDRHCQGMAQTVEMGLAAAPGEFV